MLTALPLHEANQLMALEIATNNILNANIDNLHKLVLAKRDAYSQIQVKDVKMYLTVMNNYNRTLRVLDLLKKLQDDIKVNIADLNFSSVADKYRLEL